MFIFFFSHGSCILRYDHGRKSSRMSCVFLSTVSNHRSSCCSSMPLRAMKLCRKPLTDVPFSCDQLAFTPDTIESAVCFSFSMRSRRFGSGTCRERPNSNRLKFSSDSLYSRSSPYTRYCSRNTARTFDVVPFSFFFSSSR